METNRLTNLHHNGKSIVNIGGMTIKNQIIGIMEGRQGVITSDSLIPLFLEYNNGKESLLAFLKGEFRYTMPMSRITPFKYDPSSGEEVEWEKLRIAVNFEMKNNN